MAGAARALVIHDGIWSHVWLAVAPFVLAALAIMIIVQRINRHDP